MEIYIENDPTPLSLNLVQQFYFKLFVSKVNDQLFYIVKTSKQFKEKIELVKDLYITTVKKRADGTVIEYPDLDKFFNLVNNNIIDISEITFNYYKIENDKVVFKSKDHFNYFDRDIKNLPFYIDFSSSDKNKISYIKIPKILEVFNKTLNLELRGNNTLSQEEINNICERFINEVEPELVYNSPNLIDTTRAHSDGSFVVSSFYNHDGRSAGLFSNLIFQLNLESSLDKYKNRFKIHYDLEDIKYAYNHINSEHYARGYNCKCDEDDEDCECEDGISGTLGDSCMRYSKCQDRFEIYDNKNVGCAVLYNDNGEVQARSIVWEDVDEVNMNNLSTTKIEYLYDKIYSINGESANILESLLRHRNYRSIYGIKNLLLFNVRGSHQTQYPYLDNFNLKSRDSLIVDGEGYNLQHRTIHNHDAFEFDVHKGIALVKSDVYTQYLNKDIAICSYSNRIIPKGLACTLYDGSIAEVYKAKKVLINPNYTKLDKIYIQNTEEEYYVYMLESDTLIGYNEVVYYKKDVNFVYINNCEYYAPYWWVGAEEFNVLLTLEDKSTILISGEKGHTQSKERNNFTYTSTNPSTVLHTSNILYYSL